MDADQGVTELEDNLAGGDRVASIERMVIAAIALDSHVLQFAADECSGEDFADSRLGAIFEGFFGMLKDREPIDVITVGEHLAGWGVRGITTADLHTWVSEVSSSAGVGWYAAKVRDMAVRRQLEATAVRMNQMAHGTSAPAEILAKAIGELRAVQESRVSQEVTARPLARTLLIADEYDWVIEGLLERGDRLLLTGSEGGGKTTLLRQMAVMASAGLHPFTGFGIRPSKVLYVDTENTEKQWAREVRAMAELAATRGERDPAEVMDLACIKRIDITRDSDLGMLHKLVDEHQPDILFIGPLYRLIPRAINSDDEATPLLTALDTLRDRGVCLVIEAHAGHGHAGQQERDMRPRGSSALMGWPEFGLGLRPDRNGKSSNEFQLVRWRGHRDASRKWPSRIARGIGDWPWTPTFGMGL